MGLSVVYGIIENHSGFIHVSSEKGKGSVFRIFLPVQEGEFGVQRVRNSPAVEMPGGDETILFVEDEDLLRESVEAVLSSKGYTLITARDGLEAVEKFRECIQEVDVVITDLGLPQLSGEEVFRRIREIDPKARIILASGYIDPSVRAELQKSGAQFFIQKPYYPATVLKAIRDILKGNS